MVLHRVRFEIDGEKKRQSTSGCMMLLHMAVMLKRASRPTRHGYAMLSKILSST